MTRHRCVPASGPALRGARGAVLVEFALVALAFYLLVAGIITFGAVLHSAQIAQDVARLTARELSLTAFSPPGSATMNFDQALAHADVRTRIYSPDFLVVDLDNIPGPPGTSLDAYFGTLPVVNRALRPLMIYDQPILSGSGTARRLLRVPGALVQSATAPSGLSVAIPHVLGRDASGHETIEWLAVVEEVRSDRTNPATGLFAVSGLVPESGVVGVRINIPVQSSAMGSFRIAANPTDPNLDSPNEADDAMVVQVGPGPGGALVGASATLGVNTYDGPYGLGRVQLLGKTVRPFRRLVTGQAFFRREVFAEQSQP